MVVIVFVFVAGQRWFVVSVVLMVMTHQKGCCRFMTSGWVLVWLPTSRGMVLVVDYALGGDGCFPPFELSL